MRRLSRLMFAVLLSVPLSGCLGTMVHAPTPVTRSQTTETTNKPSARLIATSASVHPPLRLTTSSVTGHVT